MAVARQTCLRFRDSGSAPSGLSAVCRDGLWLWVAGDEAPQLERLAESPDGASYADARSFRLGDVLDLPEGPDEEVDVEGLDRSSDHLWLVGSYSRTRREVRSKDTEAEAVDRLATVRSHANRHVLARLPLAEGRDGAVPVRSTTGADGVERAAALLDGGVGGLADQLSLDQHLAPFLAIPSKDNGLDVEGIVALGDTVLLGLRGPVLRGWAVVLAPPSPRRARAVGPADARVRPAGPPDVLPGPGRAGGPRSLPRRRRHHRAGRSDDGP
ncbi:Protein of unknown function [Modestobacter sp. DSM 44400]|uniref:DUF3616 domain-containing protein n=1 Tax=Modestobacter sp. DSM 44400 TaxID=1550230 RepID=UPI00089BEB4B|nr:DUF3616 domain-containing protein [Modestobacter sp. DSM 44400]SDY47962.1 Protein of unknown function [Modestobacter sp. DSM 44400]